MKRRARWLNRFTAWFFNTSPDWVAPEQDEPAAAEPRPSQRQMQQMQQPPPTSSDSPAGDRTDPDRAPR
jgi:hypothetical protein